MSEPIGAKSRRLVIKRNTDVIHFGRLDEEHSYLSNFYPSPMMIDNVLYHHVEGYYQSQKFVTENHERCTRVRNIVNPGECKRVARSVEMSECREREWNTGVKLTVMRKAVLLKFLSNSELAQKLLSTGDATLVEHAPWDNYWGNGGGGGVGLNMLGKVLMDTRTLLRHLESSFLRK